MSLSEYQKELRRAWPTQHEDMDDAWAIVSKYEKRDGQIRFIEDIEFRGDQVRVLWPDWVMDLQRHFERKYGRQQGGLVGQRIMTRMAASVAPSANEQMH